MSRAQTVTIERRDHLFLIGLNRADKMNAFNVAMLDELSRAYTAYQADTDARCAVLFAHGDNFTAGLDLAEVGPRVQQGEPLFPADHLDPLDLGLEPERPRRTKPVVCAVRGYCLTIGIELLLASDIRVAADDTRFAQLEVQRGIMPFGGATLRLPQVVGWGNAMRILLTGDRFDAAEAHRIGLVQELTSPDQVLERAIAMAERVAAQAPLAVQASLLSARKAVEEGVQAATAALMQPARALMETEDAMEGVQSFLERRAGRFSGR